MWQGPWRARGEACTSACARSPLQLLSPGWGHPHLSRPLAKQAPQAGVCRELFLNCCAFLTGQPVLRLSPAADQELRASFRVSRPARSFVQPSSGRRQDLQALRRKVSVLRLKI